MMILKMDIKDSKPEAKGIDFYVSWKVSPKLVNVYWSLKFKNYVSMEMNILFRWNKVEHSLFQLNEG